MPEFSWQDEGKRRKSRHNNGHPWPIIEPDISRIQSTTVITGTLDS
jgi:hypothetical protein